MRKVEVFIESNLNAVLRIAHRRNSGSEFCCSRLASFSSRRAACGIRVVAADTAASTAVPSPSMIRGVAFFHCDKNSATGGAKFSASTQCSLNNRAIIRQIDNSGGQKDRIARRRWSEQFDGVFRSDGAWRALLICALHQMIGCRPVAMTVEQRADDAAI